MNKFEMQFMVVHELAAAGIEPFKGKAIAEQLLYHYWHKCNQPNKYWWSVLFRHFLKNLPLGSTNLIWQVFSWFRWLFFLARSWFSKIRSLKTERSLKFEYERAFFRSSLLVVSPGFELSLLKARFNLNKSGCKWDNPLHWMESSCKLKFEKALEVVDLVMGNACL